MNWAWTKCYSAGPSTLSKAELKYEDPPHGHVDHALSHGALLLSHEPAKLTSKQVSDLESLGKTSPNYPQSWLWRYAGPLSSVPTDLSLPKDWLQMCEIIQLTII